MTNTPGSTTPQAASERAEQPFVAILDYGSGNIRSAQRAVEKAGARTSVTRDPYEVLDADGLLIPGVGAYSACMEQLRAVKGDRMIGQRLAGGRPVMGICVGMQILFDAGVEFADSAIHAGPQESGDTASAAAASTPGMGEWPGVVKKLDADVLPHMGWSTLERDPQRESQMLAGLTDDDRFYFVHSYAACDWELHTDGRTTAPLVHWARHGRSRFVAAVENGPLWATQFHPEKSGEKGIALLRNWVSTLTPRT